MNLHISIVNNVNMIENDICFLIEIYYLLILTIKEVNDENFNDK